MRTDLLGPCLPWRCQPRYALTSALVARAVTLGCGAVTLGCGPTVMPDPGDAARQYAAAAQRGDAEALHAMMTSEAQQTYGREGTERLVVEARSELAQRGQSFVEGPLQTEARAELAFADGEVAVLELEAGTFRVGSAASLPAGAATPSQALAQLRRALSRRSYPALLRVLTQGSQLHMEDQLSSLVRSLEHPEAVDVSVQGERATIELPEGHQVVLRREHGIWKVEDFR